MLLLHYVKATMECLCGLVRKGLGLCMHIFSLHFCIHLQDIHCFNPYWLPVPFWSPRWCFVGPTANLGQLGGASVNGPEEVVPGTTEATMQYSGLHPLDGWDQGGPLVLTTNGSSKSDLLKLNLNTNAYLLSSSISEFSLLLGRDLLPIWETCMVK